MFDYEYWGNLEMPADLSMALEEYFLRASRNAVFRLYSFARDAEILGYAQATDAIKTHDATFDVARRISGGSHVQTGPNILAYSVVVPRDGTFRNYEDMRAYYAEKVAEALGNLGIDNIDIDNRASTINVNGKVVASHAMVWGFDRALLHGLVIISPYDVDTMQERIHLGKRKIGSGVYTEYDAIRNMPVISRLLDDVAPVKDEHARNHILKEKVGDAILNCVTRGKYTYREIDDRVLSESRRLIDQKFSRSFWKDEKKPPFTKDEIEEIPGEKLDGPLKKGLGYCMYSQVKDKDFKKMAEPKE